MSRSLRRGLALCALLVASVVPGEGVASASEETDAIFQRGVVALKEGRAGEAIGQFEALADHGVVDAAASFNRGLAYAMRVREHAEASGDLGQAACAFEEARELAPDDAIEREATRAVDAVRSEVARRRLRVGEPANVEKRGSLGRTVMLATSEDAWAAIAWSASVLFAISLFVRSMTNGRRLRVASTISSLISGLALIVCASLATGARMARNEARAGVIVTSSARLSDERGVALVNADPLPEGARIEVDLAHAPNAKPGLVFIRWGDANGYIVEAAARLLARVE